MPINNTNRDHSNDKEQYEHYCTDCSHRFYGDRIRTLCKICTEKWHKLDNSVVHNRKTVSSLGDKN